MGAERPPALAHLRRPFLAADEIVAGRHPGEVVLRRGGRELSLEIGGDHEAAIRILGGLRDPASGMWADTGLRELVDQLDRHGWLLDGDESRATWCQDRAGELDALCDDAAAWLRDALALTRERGEVAAHRLASTLRWARNAACDLVDARRAGPGQAPDIAQRSLHMALVSWQRTSPVALQVVARALDRATADPDGPAAPLDGWDEQGLVMTDISEVRKQVWGAIGLVAMGGGPAWAARHVRHLPPTDVSGPGVNVLVAAEQGAERLLAELGPSPVFATMTTAEGADRTARCIYQHQHFITVRYVETIFSLLRYRLHEPLRQVGHQYLAEEQGHEVHELAACLALGLSETDVREFAPLPLFMAYPEVLGVIAESHPLSFCLAITAAEGLPGTVKPLPEALASRGVGADDLATHVGIDIALDHATVTRRLLGQVRWVPATTAARALADFLFVVELSQLAWHQLAHYAERPDLPATPRPFTISPADALAMWADDKA